MNETNAIVTAMGTAMSGVATDATSMISTILPIAIGIFSALILIKLGKKAFSSIAGTRP